MKLSVTPEERELLCSLIKSRTAEFYVEIRHARLSSFKDDLKQKKNLLEKTKEALACTRETGGEIDLTSEQAEVLAEFLQEELREKTSEIWHTDSSEWRDGLKAEKELILQLLQKMVWEPVF
jgi:hypothetical protein